MNPQSEAESIISSAQNHFKEKLETLSSLIRSSSEDFQSDPVLSVLKQDPVTEAFAPLRLKELYEDKFTKELIEGLKKELSQTITEYFFEMNARLNAEKKLEKANYEKKEAFEEVGILKLSIKELEHSLETLRVKYDSGMKNKQSEVFECKEDSTRRQKVIDDLEENNRTRQLEIEALQKELERERADKNSLEESLELFKRDHEGARRKLDTLEDEHYSLNLKCKDLNKQIEFLNNRILKTNSEKQEIEDSASFFKLTLESGKEKEINEWKTQVKEMKKKYLGKLETVQNKLAAKEIENEGLKNKISDLELALSVLQQRLLDEKNELFKNLEINRVEYEESIENLLSQNDYESKNLRKQFEEELESQKNYYKKIIKSQMDEFEVRAAGFYNKEKEKDEQYSNLVKQVSENYIEKKIHFRTLQEKLEESKNLHYRNLKNRELELAEHWEKELKNLVNEKNCKVEDYKKELEKSLVEVENVARKISALESIIEGEKSQNQELKEKNQELSQNLAELQSAKLAFSEQVVQVNKLAKDLKTQIIDLQSQKNQLEATNSNLEAEIELIEKSNKEASQISSKKYSDLQGEIACFLSQIEELKNENLKLNNELAKKTEQFKTLEKRFAEFKLNAKDSADKFFAEVSEEKEKSRNSAQKVLQDLELSKLELEMLQKKYLKTAQELTAVQAQNTVLKEKLFDESTNLDSIRARLQDNCAQIEELEKENEDLEKRNMQKAQEFSFIFKEIFQKISLDIRDVKKVFIEEIKILNNESYVMCSDMTNSLVKMFNSAKLNWLKEKDSLNKDLLSCKYEINKLKELLIHTENSLQESQLNSLKIIEDLQTDIKCKSEDLLKSINQLQSLESNQGTIQNLLKEREAEIFRLKEHYESILSESDLFFSDSQRLNLVYRDSLSGLLTQISDIESTYTQCFENLSIEIQQLKQSIKQETEESSKRSQELINYKDSQLLSKEKTTEYYKDLCNSLEKDAKRAESQFILKISDLESQLKDSVF